MNIEKELERAKKEGIQIRWALWCLSNCEFKFSNFEKLKPWMFMNWNNDRINEFNKTFDGFRGSERWHIEYNEYLISYVREILNPKENNHP